MKVFVCVMFVRRVPNVLFMFAHFLIWSSCWTVDRWTVTETGLEDKGCSGHTRDDSPVACPMFGKATEYASVMLSVSSLRKGSTTE